MKYSIMIIVLLSFSHISIAQQYDEAMKKAFAHWERNENVEATALFSRIAQAEPEKWLPEYYAAHVLIVQAFSEKEPSIVNQLLEKAKVHLSNAHQRSPDNSEILTLEGLFYTAYVAMDASTYGQEYSDKIMGLYQRAIELNPKNPRAHAYKIEYEMGFATFMGRDIKPLCEKMRKVIPLYKNQKLDQAFAPIWGMHRAQQIIDNCK